MYYEYGDGDFKNRLNKVDNMGLLGPIIGGEVGDVIKVSKNSTT